MDMNKEALSLLTDVQLEDLWCDCLVSDDLDLQDDVLEVLLQRPDFCTQDYDLLWALQDAGWNGCEPTEEDRLSR